jgi:hypothetical protein
MVETAVARYGSDTDHERGGKNKLLAVQMDYLRSSAK